MPALKSLAAVTACLLALVAASPVEKRATCYKGPYVIYARGTDGSQPTPTSNDPNPSDSALADIAASGLPSATMIQALQYPAAGLDPANFNDYTTSWGIGIDHLQTNITQYVDACPGSKIVLLGYSQGASVITGALMGGQGRKALATKYLNAIGGGVAIADPSYVYGLVHLDNNSTNTNHNGSFQDGNVQVNLNTALGNVFRSFCSTGDEFCANAGSSGQSIHQSAQATWKSHAVSFLQSLKL